MNLKEFYNKISIYFSATADRWPAADTDPKKELETKRLGPYQLDSAVRLTDGHFSDFDESGLPVSRWKKYNYQPIHNYSTLCCFALAHWDRYLKTGNQESADRVVATAEYFIATADHLPNGSVLLRGPGKDGSEHAGLSDALDLGQAISVLCRANQITSDVKYLSLAEACSCPFMHDLESQGVRSFSPALNTAWYEEAVEPPARHILNGMICALWGLRDLAIIAGSKEVHSLYLAGVESVAKGLPQFDTGSWSLYWVAEAPSKQYVATMNYHLLHICQLRELWKQTDNEIFKEYADRFTIYAQKPHYRMRALLMNAYTRKNIGK